MKNVCFKEFCYTNIRSWDTSYSSQLGIWGQYQQWGCNRVCMYMYIAADWNLEPDFGNLPYPEKVTGTNRSDLGKIDKIYDIFTFCETVHRNQNLEPLPKMARREPKMTTLSQFFTRKVPVKLAK